MSKWGLPKQEGRKAMGLVLEYPVWQQSLRSGPNKGKPCTWRREAVNVFNTVNEKGERHYEKFRKSIKQSGWAQLRPKLQV
ncbi:hypothetical protein FACS1894181_13600 [Bacteroidia bacterium]|nr:hypothetical protein FACS1894181_13600 [Bacteroidia bacterium]